MVSSTKNVAQNNFIFPGGDMVLSARNVAAQKNAPLPKLES